MNRPSDSLFPGPGLSLSFDKMVIGWYLSSVITIQR